MNIIQIITNHENIITIDKIKSKMKSKANNIPTHTCIIALSHQVFLNKFPDSLIASLGHILFIIIRGKEKNVNMFHIHQINHIIIFQTTEFSQNLSCNIFKIIETKALIKDQIKICFKCFIELFNPSHSLLSFPSILL